MLSGRGPPNCSQITRISYDHPNDRRGGFTSRSLFLPPRGGQQQTERIPVRAILHPADAGARKGEQLPQLLARDATIELCRVLSLRENLVQRLSAPRLS